MNGYRECVYQQGKVTELKSDTVNVAEDKDDEKITWMCKNYGRKYEVRSGMNQLRTDM